MRGDALSRSAFLIVSCAVLGFGIGALVGNKIDNTPEGEVAPVEPMMAVFLSFVSVPLVAAAAVGLTWKVREMVAPVAGVSQFVGSAVFGICVFLFATTPKSMAELSTGDKWTLNGLNIAVSTGFAFLAYVLSDVATHLRPLAPSSLPAAPAAKEPEIVRAVPIAEPSRQAPIIQAVQDNGEVLTIAKRRLATGELTKHDYDELVKRLKE